MNLSRSCCPQLVLSLLLLLSGSLIVATPKSGFELLLEKTGTVLQQAPLGNPKLDGSQVERILEDLNAQAGRLLSSSQNSQDFFAIWMDLAAAQSAPQMEQTDGKSDRSLDRHIVAAMILASLSDAATVSEYERQDRAIRWLLSGELSAFVDSPVSMQVRQIAASIRLSEKEHWPAQLAVRLEQLRQKFRESFIQSQWNPDFIHQVGLGWTDEILPWPFESTDVLNDVNRLALQHLVAAFANEWDPKLVSGYEQNDAAIFAFLKAAFHYEDLAPFVAIGVMLKSEKSQRFQEELVTVAARLNEDPLSLEESVRILLKRALAHREGNIASGAGGETAEPSGCDTLLSFHGSKAKR